MGIELRPIDVAGAVAAAAALISLGLLALTGKQRLFSYWRAAAILLLLALVFQPEAVRSDVDRRPLLAVAADVSPSMRLSGRMRSAVSFLRENRAELEKRFRIKWYVFSSGSSEINTPAAIQDKRPATGTDIGRSLWEIRREGGENLGGILLLTDGNQTGPSLQENWMNGLNTPVFPLAVETGKKIRDIGVLSLRMSDFAFKNTPLDITVRIKAAGCPGEKTTVKLWKLGPQEKLVAARPVTISGDPAELETTVSITPDESGAFKYRVEAEPLPGEISSANNRRSFELEVMREKLRLLYICGAPGPEYAFLRHALKNDPLVELVSFVILRNPENIALVPEYDLSLIPFPVHEIFTRDLNNFDVLIFENFSYRHFGFLPDYLKNIQRWVTEKGGGLIMIAGANSFGSGGWTGTPVGEILPLQGDDRGDGFDEGEFGMKAAVPSHPLLRLSDDGARNDAEWREMPRLEGCQLLNARPGAEVLGTHPWNGKPVIAFWERGKGRVLALASNTTWRWALQSTTPGRYTRFWRNAVRCVGQAGDEKRVKAQFDRPEYAAGQNFVLRLREDERAAGREMNVTLTGPSGDRTVLPAARTGGGAWEVKGSFPEAGEYRFQLSMEKDGTRIFSDTVRTSVIPSLALEESSLDNNEELLKDIAQASGGEYMRAESFIWEGFSSRVRQAKKDPPGGRIPLWDMPVFLGLIAGSFLVEWYMRKRKGLL